MLVAYKEAPTMGQVRLRPARKKLALLSLEWRRRAKDRPNPMLPISAVRQTIQSRVVRDRLIEIRESIREGSRRGPAAAVETSSPQRPSKLAYCAGLGFASAYCAIFEAGRQFTIDSQTKQRFRKSTSGPSAPRKCQSVTKRRPSFA